MAAIDDVLALGVGIVVLVMASSYLGKKAPAKTYTTGDPPGTYPTAPPGKTPFIGPRQGQPFTNCGVVNSFAGISAWENVVYGEIIKQWQIARCANGQEPCDWDAFLVHLQEIYVGSPGFSPVAGWCQPNVIGNLGG